MMEIGSGMTRRMTGVKGSPCFRTSRYSLRECVALSSASTLCDATSAGSMVLGKACMLAECQLDETGHESTGL